MERAAATRDASGRLSVTGELSAESVPGLLRETRDWFRDGGDLAVDLAGVTRADSAGVALLLDWLRSARSAGTTIRYQNPPAQMLDIIRFCALEEILPLG